MIWYYDNMEEPILSFKMKFNIHKDNDILGILTEEINN